VQFRCGALVALGGAGQPLANVIHLLLDGFLLRLQLVLLLIERLRC